MHISAITTALFLLVGCVSSGTKRSAGNEGKSLNDNRGRKEINNSEEDEFYISENLKTFTVSLSNNSQTSRAIDRREAAAIAGKLGNTDRKEIVAKMSALRLSGKGLGAVIDTTKRLMAIELQKSPKRGIPNFAKMELVLAAIESKKYSFAEYFLYDLLRAKEKKIQAMAYTAEGIIAAEDGRLPEAILSWEEALKVDPSFEAAKLNLGMTAAKYGDFNLAKKMLSGFQDDWYAMHGLIAAERLTKGVNQASSLCNRLLSTKPNYKPGLLNCALNEVQGTKNLAKATELLNKVSQLPGYPKIDASAQSLRREIQSAKRQQSPSKRSGSSRSGRQNQ